MTKGGAFGFFPPTAPPSIHLDQRPTIRRSSLAMDLRGEGVKPDQATVSVVPTVIIVATAAFMKPPMYGLFVAR